MSTPYTDHHLGPLVHSHRRVWPPPPEVWVPNGRRRRTRGRLGRARALLVASTVGSRAIGTQSTHDEDVRGGENVDSRKLRIAARYGSCAVRVIIGDERHADQAMRAMLIAPAGAFVAPSEPSRNIVQGPSGGAMGDDRTSRGLHGMNSMLYPSSYPAQLTRTRARTRLSLRSRPS